MRTEATGPERRIRWLLVLVGVVLASGCGSGATGPLAALRTAPFLLEESQPYAVRGSYDGILQVRGDTIWIEVTRGLVADRRVSPEAGVTLRYISAGLTRIGPDGTRSDFLARGTEASIERTLEPGEELTVGPFRVRIVYESPLDLDDLFPIMIHRLSTPEDPVAETYTFFPESVGEVLEGSTNLDGRVGSQRPAPSTSRPTSSSSR